MKKWGLSVLVVLSLLAMTFGTAFASPAHISEEELTFWYWGQNAGCNYPEVGGGVRLGYENGEPAVGIEVTFSKEGEDPIVVETDGEGYAMAFFPYEQGSGSATIEVDAGDWGQAEVEVSGPDPEVCKVVSPSVRVSWACGKDAPSVKLGWTGGDVTWVWARIWTEGDERHLGADGRSITFDQLIPGATYQYSLYWEDEGGNWGYTFGDSFTVPEECQATAIDLGNMVRVESPKYPGQPCYVIAPRGTDPGVESMTRTCESKNSWLDGKAREGFIGFDPKTGKMEAKITTRGEVFFVSWDNTWGVWDGDRNDNRRAPVLFTEGIGRNLLHQYCQMYKQIGTPKVLGAALCG